MNKIYRLVWNRETGTMVVASELAKSDGGRTVGGVLASPRLVISALASALLLAVGGHAMAADGQKHPISGGSGDNYCYYDSASHSVICGDGSTSVADTYDGKQAKSVAIGVSATTTGESNVALGANSSASHTSGLAIGAKTKAHNNQTIAIGENATSMGEVDIMIGKSAGLNNTATSSTGRNIGIGEGAVSKAVNANNVIGIGTGAATGIDGSHIVAIGTDANKGIKTQSSVAVGYKATSPGISSVAVGNAAKSDGTTAVAVGFEATTSGNNAVAVGKTAKAGGASVAIGANTVATQAATIAVGSGAKTGNQRAIAIGENADGAGTHTVAIGRAATSSGVSAIAIGGTQSEATKTQASGDYSIALGAQSTLAKSENTVAIGRKAAAAGNNTVSLGAESGSIGVEADAAGSLANVNARTKAGKTSANGLVNMTNIGYKAGAGNINNNYGVNIGYEAGAGGYNSFYGEGVSIGNKAGGVNTGNATVKAAMETASQVHGGVAAGVIITGNTNTAISSRAGVNALGHDNVAIGKDAGGYSSGNSNIAIGRHAGRVSVLSTSGVRVIDENAFSATRNTIALGEWAHGAANETIAIGSLARVEEKGLKSIPNGSGGYTNVDSESLNAMAVGHGAVAKGDSAIALGASSRVDFMNSIAMGAKAAALSYNSTAIGVEAKTKGYSSIAIGDKAEAGTQHADATPATNFAIAIGTSSKATGETSVALGSNAQVTTFRGTALGVLSEVKVNNGVALGASSVASRDRYQNGVDPLGAKDTSAHASVWTSTHGAVSVGDAENTDPSKRITRQITGVAAGSADTDAVNVAQLKAAGFKLTTSKSGTGEVHGDTLEKVQNGETVTIDAGDNIKLIQAANKITVAVNAQKTVESAQLPVVYTKADGSRVYKHSDGNFYDKQEGDAGATLVPKANIIASMRNPDGSATAPTILANVKAGVNDNDAVNVAQLNAAKTRFYSVNSTDTTAGNYNNDGAIGTNALAAGVNALAEQHESVAVGKGARTTGTESGSVAIGADATANGALGVAIGAGATASGDSSGSPIGSPGGIAIGSAASAKNGGMAIGSGAYSGNGTALLPGLPTLLNNNVALGDSARVKDDTNFRVALGTMSIAGEADLTAAPYTPMTGATIAGIAAPGVTLGEVSVGGDNRTFPGDILYRRITNVAAGAADTDAVNVSQLKALANAPLAFSGDTGTDVSRKLGETVKVTGGRDDEADLSELNIGVVANGSDTLEIKLAKDLIGLSSAQFQDADGNITTVDGDGISIEPADPAKGVVSLTSAGLDNGGNQITNVASGGDVDTNAANIGDVKAAAAKATTKVDAGDNIEVASTTNADGSTTYTVATKKEVAFDKVTAGTGSNQVVLDNTGVKVGANTLTGDAISVNGTRVTNVNTAINQVAAQAYNPLTFSGDTGTDVSRKLGETVKVTGGRDDEADLSELNIGVVANGSDTLEIKLAKDLIGLSSAQFQDADGNITTVDGDGISIEPADPAKGVVSLTSAGLDNGGNQITNVASGGDVDTNAANIGDVKAAAAKATTKVDAGDNIEVASTTNADGSTTYTVATKKDVTFDSVTAGGNTLDANGLAIAGGPIISVSGIDMAGKKISNLADGTEDGDAVNFSQLKAVQTLVNAGWTVADSAGNKANIGPNGVVTFSSADSNIKVAQTGADQAGKVEITLNRNLDLDSVTAGGNKLDANGLAIAGGPTISATGIDMGGKKISNLGDGTEEGDAVNLGQLKSYVGEETAKVKTHYYSVNDGGTKGGNYDNDGATGNGAIAAGVDTTATAENAVAMGKGAAASHAGSVALGAGAQTQAVDNTGTFMLNGGTAAGVNAVAVVSVGSKGNERRIVNVAAGRLSADSTDAVNGSQLFAVGTAVNNLGNATALALGGNTTYTPGGGLSVNLTVGGNTYTNVQDALNAVSGGGTGATKVVAGTNTQVTQNGDTYTVSVVDNPVVDGKATFNGGIEVAGGQSVNMGGNVVRNVAAGVADTDAVNVGQLNGAIAGANAYTDGRFNQLANDMWQIDRGYRGATASAMAMAGLPQAYLPGKSMFSAAVGGYRGEYGLAFGLSGITDNGKWVYKAQASGNTARDWGFSAGVGVQW